jgi:hypothetical protein
MSLKRAVFAGMLFMVVAFTILLPVSHAQATFTNVQCILTNSQTSIGNCVVAAIPLSLLGIALSLVIVGLAYMIGEIMNFSSLKGWYRTELWETIKSCIIIVIIFSSLIIVSAIATSLAGNTSTTTGFGGQSTTASTSITSNLASLYTTVDTKYLQPQLTNSITTFGGLLGLSVGSNLLTSLTLSVWLPIPIPTTVGLIGLVEFGFGDTNILQSSFLNSGTFSGGPSITGSTSNIIQGASYIDILMLMFFEVQHDLLISAVAVALGVLLPLGIIMRAIPFVRSMGGTLIAVAIGVAIIYPAILVGFNLPVSQYILTLTATNSTSKCPFTPTGGILCGLYNSISYVISAQAGLGATAGTGAASTAINIPLIFAFGTCSGATATANTACTTPTDTTAAAALFTQGFAVGLTGPFINGIYPALNFVIDNSLGQIVQLLLMVMDIIMTFALTQGIANLMGGSVDLSVGGLKLI